MWKDGLVHILEVKMRQKMDWGKPLHYALTPDQEHDYELYSYGSKKGKGAPKSEWIDAWKFAE